VSRPRRRYRLDKKMEPLLYVRFRDRPDGLTRMIPLRYLSPGERRDFLTRATSVLRS
jgi:hypothetical protein